MEVQSATITGSLDSEVVAVAEVQHADYTGTRSNVSVPVGGVNEIYQVQLDNNFNSGLPVGQYPTPTTGQIAFTGFGTVTHPVGANYSWPTGTPAVAAGSGWTYAPSSVSSSNNQVTVQSSFTNNTGTAISFPGGRAGIRATITVCNCKTTAASYCQV